MGTKGSTISRLSSWDGAGPDGLSPRKARNPGAEYMPQSVGQLACHMARERRAWDCKGMQAGLQRRLYVFQKIKMWGQVACCPG